VKWSLRGAAALIVLISVGVVLMAAATIMMIRYRAVERSVDRVVLASRCRQLALNLVEQGDSAARLGRTRNECEALFDLD
jgi:hypothetical protein